MSDEDVARAEREEQERVRGYTKAFTEALAARGLAVQVRQDVPRSRPHAFMPYPNASGCVRCPWPREHPVHVVP